MDAGWGGCAAPRPSARPPRYIDEMLEDFARPGATRFNHLGHWDDPDRTPVVPGRLAAQERMVDVVCELAHVTPGGVVLDAGSGFGGTAQRIEARHPGSLVIGLEVDGRQLATCRPLPPSGGGALVWVQGDACRLPLVDGCVDAAISIEAMWHFPSRTDFLAEVGRVLRPGGRLAVVELEVDPSAAAATGRTDAELDATLQAGFGPWPQLHVDLDELRDAASQVGLVEVARTDASTAVAPSFHDHGDGDERPGAAAFSSSPAVALFVELHRRGLLRVWYLAYERTAGGTEASAS